MAEYKIKKDEVTAGMDESSFVDYSEAVVPKSGGTFTGAVTVTTLSATTVYGDGSNLTGIGGSNEWHPGAISLGDWVGAGAAATIAAGAGYYYIFDAASDDEILLMHGLNTRGIEYDGSNIRLDLHWMKFGATTGTVGWELDYAFLGDGKNAYLLTDGTVTNSVDAGAMTDQIQYTDSMPNISGPSGSTHVQLTLRRNSTGVGEDTYAGDAELYSINLVKV